MAEKNLEPIAKLTPEQKQRLEQLDTDIARVEAAQESLKEMGFGVERINEHVQWAKNVRKMLLEKFT